MQRIDGPTRSATYPEPAPAGVGATSPGWFSNGDPVRGVPPTTLTADWANMIQEELVNVIVAAALPLDKGNVYQLRDALFALFVRKNDGGGAEIGTNQISVPLGGGIILKAGTLAGAFNEQALPVTFQTSFPARCLIALPIVRNTSGGNTRDVWAQINSKNAAGFVAFLQRSGGGNNSDSSDGIDWLALGN